MIVIPVIWGLPVALNDLGEDRVMGFLKIIKQRWCYLLLVTALACPILQSSQVQASTNNTTFTLEFLDDGTLTLNAKAVPLGTLLARVQEDTNLEFKVHEDHLELPISVSFQSLPLNQAIKRILRGVSYVCVFDPNTNIEEVITFSTASKDRKDSFHRDTLGIGVSYEEAWEIVPFPEGADIEEAEEYAPLPEEEHIEDAVEIVPFPEGADIEEAEEYALFTEEVD